MINFAYNRLKYIIVTMRSVKKKKKIYYKENVQNKNVVSSLFLGQ